MPLAARILALAIGLAAFALWMGGNLTGRETDRASLALAARPGPALPDATRDATRDALPAAPRTLSLADYPEALPPGLPRTLPLDGPGNRAPQPGASDSRPLAAQQAPPRAPAKPLPALPASPEAPAPPVQDRPAPTDPAAAQPPDWRAPARLAASTDRTLRAALSQSGVEYRLGGDAPDEGFDCSGLTRWAFGAAGTALPRTSREQFASGRPVDKASLRAGDLVFFGPSGQVNHVGICLDRSRFVHSSRSGGAVGVSSLAEPRWERLYAGARRVTEGAGGGHVFLDYYPPARLGLARDLPGVEAAPAPGSRSRAEASGSLRRMAVGLGGGGMP